MSDPKSPLGEPETPRDPAAAETPREPESSVDDVVGSAHEGLRDAEAAGRDAADDEAAPAAASEVPWYERDDVPLDDDPVATPASDAPTVVVADPAPDQPTAVITPSEPVVAPAAAYVPAAVAPAAAQPIFVQAPEPPRPRGNRAAAGAIGLIAALVFAVLFLGVWLIVGLVGGEIASDEIASALTAQLASWTLWVPVVVFFLAFWLLGAIINRGRWAHWVVFGLLVGVAAYGGYLLGQLFQAPFWTLTAAEGGELVEKNLLVPMSIASFIIARELTIWFGAWVSSRGKRVTELNYEAQREYERTLEAGPTIVPSAQG
jgi:hypothetical protein